MVSHDRYLINKLADKVYVLSQNGAALYHGNYDYYLEKREAELIREEKKAEPKVNLYKLRKEREAELRKKRAALSRLEQEIEENDKALQALEEKLEDPTVATDYEAITEATGQIAALHEKAEALLTEWSTLSEELLDVEEEQKDHEK